MSLSAQSDAKVVSVPGKASATANAAGAGNTKVVRLLLSHANDAAFNGSRHALNWAAAGERIRTVEVLIEHGVDVNTLTKSCVVGKIPLPASCGSRKVDQ